MSNRNIETIDKEMIMDNNNENKPETVTPNENDTNVSDNVDNNSDAAITDKYKNDSNDNDADSATADSSEKTFTQEQVSHIVAERLSRLKKSTIESEITAGVEKRTKELSDENEKLKNELTRLKNDAELNEIEQQYDVPKSVLIASGLHGDELRNLAENIKSAYSNSAAARSSLLHDTVANDNNANQSKSYGISALTRELGI